MSFIDDVIDGAGSLFGGAQDIFSAGVDYLKGDSLGSSLAKVALLGAGLRAVNNMVNADNSKPATAIATPNEPDRGVRLQVNPDPKHKIPVVYGSAHLGGIITDAVLTNDNKTMYYCIAICEQTGNLISTGESSRFTLNELYWDDKRVVFQEDGITAAYTVDRDSNVDYSIADLVKVYFFQSPYINTQPGYTITSFMSNTAAVPHYEVPSGTGVKTFYYYQGQTNWGSNNVMTRLVPGDHVRVSDKTDDGFYSTLHANNIMTGTVVSANVVSITANLTSFTGNSGTLMSNILIQGLISQQSSNNYELKNRLYGYDIMPGWDSTYTMPDLVYAIVRVDYSKEKGITQIPNLRWHITNSMTLPGDCIYDYATNTRYGAGIDPTEIYS